MPREIPLTKGKVALVSAKDYARLRKFPWFAVKIGKTFYAMRKYRVDKTVYGVEQKGVYMHREVLGLSNGKQVDHKDCNGLNNTRRNLRAVTQGQNKRLSGPERGRKYKGVYRCACAGVWRAAIYLEAGRSLHIGCFLSEEDAALAYDLFAKQAPEGLAYLNFPKATQRERKAAYARRRRRGGSA